MLQFGPMAGAIRHSPGRYLARMEDGLNNFAHGDTGSAIEQDGKTNWLLWASVGILLLLNILAHVDRTIITLMVDPMKKSLQISDLQFSLLQGLAFTMFYVSASLPMGWLADRYSRHWVIYLGVTGWSLSTALCGLAGNFWQLFTARLGVGCGEATLSPASYALLGDLFPPHRVATAAGILAGGGAIGAAAAFAVGGLAVEMAEAMPPIAGLEPWQLVFLVVGLPGVVIAPLVFLIPRRRAATPRTTATVVPTAAPGYGTWLLSNAGFLVPMALGIGGMSIQGVGGNMWMPSYLTRHFHMDIGAVGVTLGLVNGIPGLIGFIGGGWVIDWLNARGMKDVHFRFFIIAATLVAITGVTTFVFSGSLPTTLFFWAIVNMFIPLTGPAVGFIQQSTPQYYRARTTAILFMIMYFFGMAVGPILIAYFAEAIFGGPEHIGSGIALVHAIFGPLTILSFALAVRPARRARAALALDIAR